MDMLFCVLAHGFAVLIVVAAVIATLVLLVSLQWREQNGDKVVMVMVLGDVGRSPRMQYHCLSLVQNLFTVELVGYGDSQLIKELRENPRLQLHALPNVPLSINRLPHLLRYIIKVIHQTVVLLWTILRHTKKPSHILMQSPPSIPTMFVALVVSVMRGSKLVVDYHNYGHTILALSLGQNHPLVGITKFYEWIFGCTADASLCVSEAMKKDLSKNWGVHAIILYDRPPIRFHSISTAEKHFVCLALSLNFPFLLSPLRFPLSSSFSSFAPLCTFLSSSFVSQSSSLQLFFKLSESEAMFRAPEPQPLVKSKSVCTAFSESTPTGIRLREDRPFLVVSSTSWTEDEDFSILVKALEIYDEKAALDNQLPRLMCVITGKGPLRAHYEYLMGKKTFKHLKVGTIWLSSEDYPKLLAAADLGVCLHKSSSGLDLPMKIVDMFGCGLPVCAVQFDCLHELLRNEHNGLTFIDHTQLADQLQRLARSFPSPNPYLRRFRDNLVSFHSLRWDHYWKLHVLPLMISAH